ncbi:O-antigen ligase family protein [Merdibacter massiliensis]|uniref:O-antigen ligase family protein n=1 Tax=Merdibacter massiliensis TaxID=1871030 RepID=UPI001F3FB9FE|nr:O-antigen ligase family protein [Merdibacter massiliensis]
MRWIENIKAFYHRKLDGYSFEEYLIMFVTCSIFLPYFCSLIAIVFVLCYLAYTHQLIKIIRKTPRAFFIFLFCMLSFAVSAYYQNDTGMVQSFVMLLIFLYYMFYRSIINKRLFILLIDACCIISIFCFIWAIMEYFRIIDHFGYNFLDLEVEDAPRWRVNSTFYNANLYAMMIEFLVLCCVYKLLYSKALHRIFFYWGIILLNLFALYLTGCRTAWASFVVAIPVMFFLTRHWKSFTVSMGIILSGLTAVLADPSLLPRSGFLDSFIVRGRIWKTALLGIRDHLFFGGGPQCYQIFYKLYDGRKAMHAHNVFLDPLLSHGIIGLLILFSYFWENLKEIKRLYTKRYDVPLFALIVAFLLTVVIHGMLDHTINWIQTAMLFLMVFSSSAIYVNNGGQPELEGNVFFDKKQD